MPLNAYISWYSLAGDEKDAWLRSFAIAFAATGGTSFRDADFISASEIRSIIETVGADGLMEMANHESTGAVIYRWL